MTRWSSLEWKLPLLIGGLLVVVIALVAVAASNEVRRSAGRVGSERAANVTRQFRELFGASVVQLRQRIAPVAADPALTAYATRRDARSTAAAMSALKQISAAPDQVVATELRDGTGRVLLTTAPAESALATMAVRDIVPSLEPGDSAIVGQFRLLRDTLIYPIASPVRGASDLYVVRWRKMVGSRRTREQLNQLVGSDASIFLGNARGTEWHDLERPVTRPEFVGEGESAPHLLEVGGRRSMAAYEMIPGAPWMVAVAFPAEAMFAPADAFEQRMAMIVLLAFLAGLIAAWILSRRITRPLRDLTNAAEGVAAGLYGQQVRLSTNDELGRLADSFSAMSAEVQRTRDGLEELVRQRTRELEEAQDALVKRERLAMLGQLSSGVGHELRNPLGVMTNSVYYLKTVLHDASPKVQEYLGIIQQQISLSEKIVSDLLDFARRRPPQRQAVSPREITESQVARLGGRDGLVVDVGIPASVPRVLVDPTQFGQIVFNLLTNAAQAMEGRGTIRVRADESNGTVAYTVEDGGPGIPPENLERIFEPLFTTKARGIGLGLAVSRMMARANGGDIVVRSAPGRGATFTVTLEAAVATASGLPASHATVQAAGIGGAG